MSSYGWSAFDPEIVARLHRRDPDVLDTSAGGGMRCPLASHNCWLQWNTDYTKGTQTHGDPAVSFRVSPTYILADPLENFIAGRELVAGALRGEWKKAETFRLGYENSEDAVSWNVFRALQEAGNLELAARVLTGIDITGDVELLLWGQRINIDDTADTPVLQQALNRLEPKHTQQTEPDVILRVPGWGWIFIEAKLSSPTSTYAGKREKLKSWIERYADASPGLFASAVLQSADASRFPEQLLRNVVVADAVRDGGERAVVVALVREQYAEAVDGWAGTYLAPNAPVSTRSATWEQLYAALPATDARLATLRNYMWNKSAGLRPAFRLDQASGSPGPDNRHTEPRAPIHPSRREAP